MPIRIGEVFLFAFFVLLLYVLLGDRPRVKAVVQRSTIETQENFQAAVSETVAPAPTVQAERAPPTAASGMATATGRKANVAGIWGTFECVEYSLSEGLEVHVHQIDENGRQLAPSNVHSEPFESVVETYTAVTAW